MSRSRSQSRSRSVEHERYGEGICEERTPKATRYWNVDHFGTALAGVVLVPAVAGLRFHVENYAIRAMAVGANIRCASNPTDAVNRTYISVPEIVAANAVVDRDSRVGMVGMRGESVGIVADAAVPLYVRMSGWYDEV